MKLYGLLGYPLSHSFSKVHFTNKFRNESIDAAYNLFPIPDISEFPALLKSHPSLKGLNVTIPYKQLVMAYLDELDPEAEAIGAINVIRFEPKTGGGTKLVGYNSDLYGFRESIRPLIQQLQSKQSTINQKLKALVLGTGGASKAVLFGLKQLGIETLLISRNEGENQLPYTQLASSHFQDYKIIINTTPLGMSPNINECPPIDYSQLNSNHLLYDLVYNPENTLFLQKGEQQGALVKNGFEMLQLQAEKAWEIWNEV